MEKIRDKLISPFFLVKNEKENYSLRKGGKIILNNSSLDYVMEVILKRKDFGKKEYNSLEDYINELKDYKNKLIGFKQKVLNGDNN